MGRLLRILLLIAAYSIFLLQYVPGTDKYIQDNSDVEVADQHNNFCEVYLSVNSIGDFDIEEEDVLN